MTKEKIQQQLERAYESKAKLEMDKEDLNEQGYWALGYWNGKISVLEELLEKFEHTQKNLDNGGIL